MKEKELRLKAKSPMYKCEEEKKKDKGRKTKDERKRHKDQGKRTKTQGREKGETSKNAQTEDDATKGTEREAKRCRSSEGILCDAIFRA